MNEINPTCPSCGKNHLGLACAWSWEKALEPVRPGNIETNPLAFPHDPDPFTHPNMNPIGDNVSRKANERIAELEKQLADARSRLHKLVSALPLPIDYGIDEKNYQLALRFAEKAKEENGWEIACMAAREELADALREVETLTADNVAMREVIMAYRHGYGSRDYIGDAWAERKTNLADSVLTSPHPGASLLAELEKLTADNAALVKFIENRWYGCGCHGCGRTAHEGHTDECITQQRHPGASLLAEHEKLKAKLGEVINERDALKAQLETATIVPSSVEIVLRSGKCARCGSPILWHQLKDATKAPEPEDVPVYTLRFDTTCCAYDVLSDNPHAKNISAGDFKVVPLDVYTAERAARKNAEAERDKWERAKTEADAKGQEWKNHAERSATEIATLTQARDELANALKPFAEAKSVELPITGPLDYLQFRDAAVAIEKWGKS